MILTVFFELPPTMSALIKHVSITGWLNIMQPVLKPTSGVIRKVVPAAHGPLQSHVDAESLVR